MRSNAQEAVNIAFKLIKKGGGAPSFFSGWKIVLALFKEKVEFLCSLTLEEVERCTGVCCVDTLCTALLAEALVSALVVINGCSTDSPAERRLCELGNVRRAICEPICRKGKEGMTTNTCST